MSTSSPFTITLVLDPATREKLRRNAAARARFRALQEWLNLPRPVALPLLDDSRAALYEEEAGRQYV